ncbi:MAG: DUF389 domain-containing protein [Microcystaceae cyanobacterium]
MNIAQDFLTIALFPTITTISLTRQSIANSIAGVAIAVALVPPLCVTGIALGIGTTIYTELDLSSTVVNYWQIANGSFLLFIVNLSGITFSACLIFLSQSYGSWRKALQRLIIWLVAIIILCFPLQTSMREFVLSKRINEEMRKIRELNPEISQKTRLRRINVRLKDNNAYLSISMGAPPNTVTDEYLATKEQRLSQVVSQMGIQSMKLQVRIYPVEIQEYERNFEGN